MRRSPDHLPPDDVPVAEIPDLLETQQGNICTRKAAVSEPKGQSAAAAPEESLGTDARTLFSASASWAEDFHPLAI
ncbi:hypothetical protein WKK05_37330 (plasmid) [Nostoc sp. UHCC 0302]|uniref:hypothetical protein n=1 Tax=Nostoc sp. UHCC 0302 TaxID=3134896 RepID=UPI00311CDA8D